LAQLNIRKMKATDLYERIDEKTLLDLISKATLVVWDKDLKVSTPKHNSLFGCTDYGTHPNTMEEAKIVLKQCIEKKDLYNYCHQNLNYYVNGKSFDTIVFQGFRGGYRFHIGWKNESGNLADGTAWNNFITSYF